MLLKDKVVIVSGVGPGMGQALARIAAAEGARVALGARSKDLIEEVAADIKAKGGQAIAVPTDISSAAACEAMAQATIDAFGTIDGLVNTAYIHGAWLPVDEADPEDYARVFDVNCLGAMRMAQAVIPTFKAKHDGAIINVSTMSTVNPFTGEGGYATGKGGLNVLSRHMANDFGKYGVRVNHTRMGWIGGKPVYDYIDRAVAAGGDRDQITAEIAGRIPLDIIPPEDDCAKAVLFFLSDYARVVTGAVLDVNGGQYMAP